VDRNQRKLRLSHLFLGMISQNAERLLRYLEVEPQMLQFLQELKEAFALEDDL
jgi:hypothetical protein